MSSELSRSSSPRPIAGAVALVFATAAIGCVGPDAFNRDAGGFQTGAGGNDGFAGQTGAGGSGMGGATAMGGQTGAGGKTGVGGSGAGGSAAGGRGGSGMGGAGMGGRGMGGATGMGGAPGTDGGTDGDGAGAGGNGAGGAGMGGAGGGTVVFSDNFESYLLNVQPPTWTRFGGSANDYQVVVDGTQVLTQNRTATGTTYRACYASSAPGAPWSGATTVSAQVKVTGIGTTPTALFCVRYTTGNAGFCLALLPNTGVQFQVRAADVVSASSPVTTMTITVATQYNVRVSVDGAGVLSGSVNGTAVGPYTPTGTATTSGYVGVATQMATATFDNLVVTQP